MHQAQYLTSAWLLGRFCRARQRAHSIDFRLHLASANQRAAAGRPQTKLDVCLLQSTGKRIEWCALVKREPAGSWMLRIWRSVRELGDYRCFGTQIPWHLAKRATQKATSDARIPCIPEHSRATFFPSLSCQHSRRLWLSSSPEKCHANFRSISTRIQHFKEIAQVLTGLWQKKFTRLKTIGVTDK